VQSEGPKIPPMEFAEAVEVLAGLVSEYESAYAEKSDRSRYYALLLGPEMQSAGFVTGEYPLGFFDAADINHGKSSAAMRICLFYGERPAMVMPVSGQGGGVARFESLLSAALLEMKRFNFIDNWRGHINSSLLNTLLTELIAQLRASYDRERQISAAGRIFLLSSNSAEPGPDLFSRSLPVRLKSPAVWIMPKSDREAQIRAEFPRLTAARRAIIRRWHAQDCPKGNDKRHRFTGFFGPMCGLIEGTLGMSPILDGVESEARWRQEPVLVWLRQLADFYREKDPGRLRGAKDLFDDCRAHNMTPPGFVKGRESIQLRKDIGLALRAAAERRTEADLGLYTAFLVHQATTARAGSNYASGRWQVRFVLK